MNSAEYRAKLDIAHARTLRLNDAIASYDRKEVARLLPEDYETKQMCLRGEGLPNPRFQPLRHALEVDAPDEIRKMVIPRLDGDDLRRALSDGQGYTIAYLPAPG